MRFVVLLRILLPLSWSYKVNFDTSDGFGWYPYNFSDIVVIRVVQYHVDLVKRI